MKIISKTDFENSRGKVSLFSFLLALGAAFIIVYQVIQYFKKDDSNDDEDN